MYSDEELIAGIQQGGITRDKHLTYIFDQYAGFVVKLQQEKRLTLSEAKDAYVDAVVALGEKVANGKFQGNSKLSTYLYRIFSNKCIDVIRKKTARQVDMTYELPDLKDPEKNLLDALAIRDQAGLLKEMVQELGAKCQQILMDWAYHGYKMDEIAQRAGLKDADSAYSQKYKCLKKLRERIKSTFPQYFESI